MLIASVVAIGYRKKTDVVEHSLTGSGFKQLSQNQLIMRLWNR